MAFKQRTIEFCGKARKFKRCANKELKNYQKQLEKLQDDAIPLTREVRDLQYQIDEKNEEINSLDKSIELLERLNEPDDEEIRESMKLVREKVNIQRELNELKKQSDEKQFENIQLGLDLDEKLRGCYAEFANKIFEDFPISEFEEYADATDMIVAQRLPELYRYASTNASQKEIDRQYKKIIEDSFQ